MSEAITEYQNLIPHINKQITKHNIMKVLIAKSIYVLPDSEYFFLAIGYRHWSLGVKAHSIGLRIMLIWWHILIKF